MSEEYRYYIAIEHILGGLKYQTDEEVEQIIRRLKQTDGESWACGETLERLLTVRRAWANPKTEVEFEILSTYDKIQEENERLREALMYIANFGDEDTVYMCEQMQEIAQQALKEVTK